MSLGARPLGRSLANVTTLTLLGLGLGPAAATPPRAAGPSIDQHRTFSKHWRGTGTLVALHDAGQTGDLATAGEVLIPLRFSSRAQERGLRPGDTPAVSADAHGHARLLVRSLSSKHWRSGGVGGASKHWRVRGVVARTLDHGRAEVLGVNGAAIVVDASGALVTSDVQPAAAQHGATLFGPALASAASNGPQSRVSRLVIGQAIEMQVALGRAGALAATTVRVVAARVARIDVEGTVARVDRKAGTITVVDENGLGTIVRVSPATIAAYRVGQGVEASGSPTGHGTMQAREIERDVPLSSGQPPSKRPGNRPAPSPVATHTGAPLARSVTTPSPTPATPVPPDRAASPAASPSGMPGTAAPTQTGTSAPAATPTSTTSPPVVVVVIAPPTSTQAPAAPAAPAGTETREPSATATRTATATATVTVEDDPERGGATPPPPPSATPPTGTSTPLPTATNKPTSTTTSTAVATATATACQATMPTPLPTTASNPTPIPRLPKGAPKGLKIRYQVGDPGHPCDGYIVPKIQIVNTDKANAAAKDLIVRYWFGADTTRPQNWFSAPLDNNNWTAAIYTPTAPIAGADVAIAFSANVTNTQTIAANGGASDALSIIWCKPGSAAQTCPAGSEPFNEYNDYSYNPSMTSYADWDRVTLYWKDNEGVEHLIWGAEPH